MRKALLAACPVFVLVVLALVLAPLPADAQGMCSAIQFCRSGTNVACDGANTCTVGTDFVECDGNRAACNNNGCTATYRCPKPPFSQAWALSCSSTLLGTDCTIDAIDDTVRCGHDYRTCDECEAAAQIPGGKQCLAFP